MLGTLFISIPSACLFEATTFILVIKQRGARVSVLSIFSRNGPSLVRTHILALWTGLLEYWVSLDEDFREWPSCLLGLGKGCCLAGGRDLGLKLLLRKIVKKFSFHHAHPALLTLSYWLPLIPKVRFSGKMSHCLSCPHDRLRLQLSWVVPVKGHFSINFPVFQTIDSHFLLNLLSCFLCLHRFVPFLFFHCHFGTVSEGSWNKQVCLYNRSCFITYLTWET